MLFFCLSGMIMIIYSPFGLTIALLGLISLALFDIQKTPFKLRLHPQLRSNWFGFWRAPSHWMTSLMFFIVLLSVLYSTDWDYSAGRLKLKISFLVLPFVFYSLPRLSSRAYQGLFYCLVIVLFLTNLMLGANYLLNFEEINKNIALGQPMPTFRNHVRYSLLLGVGILSGLVLVYRRFSFKYTFEVWMIAAMTLFNFIFIHILSVRSGLAVLYITILIGCFALVFLQRRYLLGTLCLSAMILAPVFAYYTIPSFYSKVHYANWELHEYRHGRTPSGSDQGRFRSYIVGWEVFSQQPVLGVGAGDLRQEVHQQYDLRYPDQERKLMPHNQFLTVAGGTGLIGLLLFLLAFFYPFLYKGHFRDPFYFIFFLAFLLSFMVESTLENSIGIGFYVIFLGVFQSYLTGDNKEDNYGPTP